MRLKLFTNPVWRYLNQNLGSAKSIWSVKRFWYLYKVEFLQKCWQQDLSQESRPHH